MKIHVTQEDIDQGEKNNCIFCPVALALSKLVPNRTLVYVHLDSVHLWNYPDRTEIALPPHVSAFIEEFDRGIRVSPFSFELDYNPKQ